jgi:hypothetical protein
MRARAGAEVVVFYNADIELVRSWWRDSGIEDELRVAADPDAGFYEALGTKRTNPVALTAGSLGAALKSARKGLIPRATRADMLRLGADIAVRADGELALRHIAGSPDDRLPVEQLLDALR